MDWTAGLRLQDMNLAACLTKDRRDSRLQPFGRNLAKQLINTGVNLMTVAHKRNKRQEISCLQEMQNRYGDAVLNPSKKAASQDSGFAQSLARSTARSHPS